MFDDDKQTLIVVYKDEMLMNQLRKMVETHDDNGQDIIGTRDDSINIVSWTEKVWMVNKKQGNLKDKILFLGDIKGTDKLIPVIDVKFDEFGVRFGWAGNQAVIYADTKVLTSRRDYDAFLEKLSVLSVPGILKTAKKNMATAAAEQNAEAENGQKEAAEATVAKLGAKAHEKKTVLDNLKKPLITGTHAVKNVSKWVASKPEEVFRNKSLMKRQMLFYGVVYLYYDGLEEFMNA